jgi:hypothetical protein
LVELIRQQGELATSFTPVMYNLKKFICSSSAVEIAFMQMPLVSRILFVLVSVLMAVGAHIADYRPTHIFNPLWPPRAKFHTGQTLGFSILLALLTIYFSFRKTKDKTYAVLATASFAASYWVTQACAIFTLVLHLLIQILPPEPAIQLEEFQPSSGLTQCSLL